MLPSNFTSFGINFIFNSDDPTSIHGPIISVAKRSCNILLISLCMTNEKVASAIAFLFCHIHRDFFPHLLCSLNLLKSHLRDFFSHLPCSLNLLKSYLLDLEQYHSPQSYAVRTSRNHDNLAHINVLCRMHHSNINKPRNSLGTAQCAPCFSFPALLSLVPSGSSLWSFQRPAPASLQDAIQQPQLSGLFSILLEASSVGRPKRRRVTLVHEASRRRGTLAREAAAMMGSPRQRRTMVAAAEVSEG